MVESSITQLRLHSQRLDGARFNSPVEVVRWLGAVQAQDYPAAKWAVGQRTRIATDTAVEKYFNDGAILRTHVLRPTWQFVAREDIRWMLALTAPQVKAANAAYYRRLGLDQTVFERAYSTFEKALQGGPGSSLTRAELKLRLEQAGVISAADEPLRSLFILINAELDGIICSGALRGKQHTYALLAERAPDAPAKEREESMAELAWRYFISRGPATLKDFAWWSGLSAADARTALALNEPQLVEEMIDGQPYWLEPKSAHAGALKPPAIHLLPDFDEYVVAYTDRSAIFDPAQVKQVDARGNLLFNNTLLVDGKVAGTWKRTLKKDAVEVAPNPFSPLSEAQNAALDSEMLRYSQFLGLALVRNGKGGGR